MKFTSANGPRGLKVLAIGAFVSFATSAMAVERQADFVFDALGPVACEVPPAGFDISQFRAYAQNTPDAPLVRGEIGGALATSFAGGGLYGADEAGGFVVGVQGMLFDDAPELTMMCMVLVRLGESEETTGPIVGENGLDAAADGSFLGVFKLVRRNADGIPATVATGTVESGTARFGMFDGILVDGSIVVEGSYTLENAPRPLPFSASIAIPRAENVIRPALRLSRN